MSETKQIRAFTYARVSNATDDPEPQLAALRDFVRGRNWILVREYLDEAAANEIRPVWSRVVGDALAGFGKVIVVESFSRIGGSVGSLLFDMQRFSENGVRFVSVKNILDLEPPLSEQCTLLMRALSIYSQENLREKILAGQAKARAAGRIPNRRQLPLDNDRIRSDYKILRSIRRTASLHRCSAGTVWNVLNNSR